MLPDTAKPPPRPAPAEGPAPPSAPRSALPRRRAALLKAGALQSAIQGSAGFASIATDEQGLIQVFSVGAERLLGHGAAEVVGQLMLSDLVDPAAQRERANALGLEFGTVIAPGFAAMAYKASRGIDDVHEMSCLTKAGDRLSLWSSVSALRDEGGALIGYLLVGMDNSARQRAEAERNRLDLALATTHTELQEAKVAAERANLAKSEFLSSMSHELRSPLNAILGFAQLMESGAPAPTPAQKDSIDQILQAGWYLLELINEILDLSLIESGRLSLSPEPVSLGELMAECQAMIEPQAQQAGIQVAFATPASPLAVLADRTRVKQVVINLLSNAIKYNRVGGRVDVRCDAAGNAVRIGFQDTGEGLSTAKLAQLFQPFNRLGQEAGVVEGTGIGLVVSKRLVELMGGRIQAFSTPGVGSLFTVELPAAAALEALESPSSPVTGTGGGDAPDGSGPLHTVLCVEDNPANLMLVTRLLARRPDIGLVSARDGRRGVEMARALRPAVILMDINLPGISGLNALELLAGDAATARIPVVALSANAMPRDVQRGLDAGFFRYLTKPIKVDEFMNTIDQALAAAAALADLAGTPR